MSFYSIKFWFQKTWGKRYRIYWWWSAFKRAFEASRCRNISVERAAEVLLKIDRKTRGVNSRRSLRRWCYDLFYDSLWSMKPKDQIRILTSEEHFDLIAGKGLPPK